DTQPDLEGGGRHLPPAAGTPDPGRQLRQPVPEPDLGRAVPRRLREAPDRHADAGHDVLLHAPPQPAGRRPQDPLQRLGRGARLRHGGAVAPRDHQELLRLDLVHAVALRADRAAGRDAEFGPERRHRRQPGQRDVLPDRVRPDPQPDPDRQLQAGRVGAGHALPPGHRRPADAGPGVDLRLRLRRLPSGRGPDQLDPAADLPPAGPARRAHLALRRLALQHVPGHPERVQRPEPGADRVRLPLPPVGPRARGAVPARHRPQGEVLMKRMKRMKRTKRTAMTVAALSALAGGAGCSNFEDETTVIDLRVLGLAAQPPEIYVDQSTLDSRTDPFTSDITALVVDPKGAGRPVSYSVLACPREIDAVTAATGRNGVVCQPNVSGMPPNSLEVTSGETTDPGPVHEIPFTFQVPPELLKLAFSVDLPAGSQGFQLPIVLQMQLGAGTESVTATKRVIFSQPIPDHEDQPANANPVITQVMTYTDRDADAN